MKYRVGFTIGAGYYYTEWLETLVEVEHFVEDAGFVGMSVREIEDEDGQVV